MSRNDGLTADVLFVAVPRPPMGWGVAYGAPLLDLVFPMEIFFGAQNLLPLFIAASIHSGCALPFARDARCFDLLLRWGRTRMPSHFANYRAWAASSYSPLKLDLPNRFGRRAAATVVAAQPRRRP